jgi:hypothetical protein
MGQVMVGGRPCAVHKLGWEELSFLAEQEYVVHVSVGSEYSRLYV